MKRPFFRTADSKDQQYMYFQELDRIEAREIEAHREAKEAQR
jgi:hypothetical protein